MDYTLIGGRNSGRVLNIAHGNEIWIAMPNGDGLPHETYTLRVLGEDGSTLKFFAHETLSDLAAVEELLRHYHPPATGFYPPANTVL